MTSSSNVPLQLRILKMSSCPSLSRLSTLSYELGCDDRSNILIRLTGNSGGGYYNKDWVLYSLIDLQLLSTTPLTHQALKACYEGRSVNSPGFLLAVMKELGLIEPCVDNPRIYQRTDTTAFLADVNALITSSVDLANEPTKKTRGKPKAIAPANSQLE